MSLIEITGFFLSVIKLDNYFSFNLDVHMYTNICINIITKIHLNTDKIELNLYLYNINIINIYLIT